MKVFFFGLGYCAEALVRRTPGIEPSGTARTDDRVAELKRRGVEAYAFDGARAEPGLEDALKRAEAIVVSIPPRGPVGPLDAFGPAIAAAPNLRSALYYSTIGVYGEHGGAWVDETSATLTRNERALARLADEKRFTEAGRARGFAIDILRLPGIYGPGRNALEKLRKARRAGSSSPAMSSTAPMSTTSPKSRASFSRAGSPGRFGTSPMTSPPRLRT